MSESMRTYRINNQRTATAVFYKQLQDLNDSVANDTKFGKNARTGYFCLAKYGNTGNEQHFSKNVDELLHRVQNDSWNNWYIAPNTFRVNWTRTEFPTSHHDNVFNNIRALTSFYLDFDVEKNHLDMKLFEYDLMHIILPKCQLRPTMVSRTGHGYHVYFLLDKVVAVNNERMNYAWKRIQDYIYHLAANECQKLYGKNVADSKVTDINRILRVPTSHNMKRYPNPMVKIVYLNILNRVNFGKLKSNSYQDYMSKMASIHPYCKVYKLIKSQQSNETESSHSRLNNGNKELTVSSLQSKRCKDIFKLAQERSLRHSINLYREESMFLYACSAVVNYKSNDKIAKKLSELNHTFWKPCAANEVNHVIKELPKIRHKVTSFRPGKKLFKHYIYTNSEYISELGITSQEQALMQTLIGTNEKAHRYQARLAHRKALRLPKIIKLDERHISRDIRMNEQHRNGMTYNEIITNDNYHIKSTKTVQRAVKLLNDLMKIAKINNLIIKPDMISSLSRISATSSRTAASVLTAHTYIISMSLKPLNMTNLYPFSILHSLGNSDHRRGDNHVIGLHGG